MRALSGSKGSPRNLNGSAELGVGAACRSESRDGLSRAPGTLLSSPWTWWHGSGSVLGRCLCGEVSHTHRQRVVDKNGQPWRGGQVRVDVPGVSWDSLGKSG